MLQRLFPIGIRGCLTDKNVYAVLVRLGNVFQQLFVKTLYVKDFETRKKDKFSFYLNWKVYSLPLTSFDVMVHLVIYFPLKIKLVGPINSI